MTPMTVLPGIFSIRLPALPRPGRVCPIILACMIVVCALARPDIPAAAPAFATEAASATPHNGGRMVTDMAGRQVPLKREVRRIITTFKPATLSVFCLGLADRLVGMDDSSRRDPLHKTLLPDISAIPGVGRKATGINVETIVALAPDLVVLYAQRDGLELADRFSALNIPAVVILPETFDTITASLAVLATAAGANHRLARIRAAMEGILSRLDRSFADLPRSGRLTGYFASPQGLFSTASGQMLQHEIFERAGLVNVSADLTGYFRTISPEQLIRWNPQVIVLSRHMKGDAGQRLSDPAIRNTSAVSNQRVFRCPSTLAPWDFPSPLSVLASLWLAKTAYPDRFSHIDLEKEADAFHHLLFGRTLTGMGGKINHSSGDLP